jgi:hypothetical protein
MLFGGRIMFLRFLRVLARVVEDRTAARRADYSFALFLADWAAVLLGTGIAIAGSAVSAYAVSTPVAFTVYTLTGMSGLVGLVVYDRVLGGLTRSVRAFADADRSDEEDDDRWREEGEGSAATDPRSES